MIRSDLLEVAKAAILLVMRSCRFCLLLCHMCFVVEMLLVGSSLVMIACAIFILILLQQTTNNVKQGVVSYAFLVTAAPAEQRIHDLPGIPSSRNFSAMYSGYVAVGSSNSRELFYW